MLVCRSTNLMRQVDYMITCMSTAGYDRNGDCNELQVFSPFCFHKMP